MSFRDVWILVQLRWRLILASFAGKTGKQAAAILGFILIVCWAAVFATSSYVVLKKSQDWTPEKAALAQPAILRLTFFFTFLLQVATSVATLSVSDFFDTSRLLHLPVRARSIFAAMLVSSVVSPSTLVFGAPAFGVMAALDGSAGVQVFRFAVTLMLIVFGQAMALFAGYLLVGALTRRRLRDAATILGSVLGLGSYVLMRMMTTRQETLQDWIGSGTFWHALDFLPTSWFADLLGWTELPGPAILVGLVPPLLAVAASLVLGAWSFSRFYRGAGATTETEQASAGAPPPPRLLPAEIGAVARQTLSVIWREPQLKAMLFQQMIFLLFPFFTIQSGKGMDRATWWVPFFMVFSHAWLALSLLGIDGPGLKLLLQTPAARTRILLGRVLALGWLFAAIDVVTTAALVAVMHYWSGLSDPGAKFGELVAACVIADWVVVGAGALISVLVPFPIVRKGKHLRMRQEGCATNLGRVLLRTPVIFIGVAVGIVSVFPELFGMGRIWLLASIPIALGVAVGIAAASISTGARRLLEREEEIVAALADTGD
jgi:hypothetical protein